MEVNPHDAQKGTKLVTTIDGDRHSTYPYKSSCCTTLGTARSDNSPAQFSSHGYGTCIPYLGRLAVDRDTTLMLAARVLHMDGLLHAAPLQPPERSPDDLR